MHTVKVVSTVEALKEKIESKTARVGIVGLGYVGLPLASRVRQGWLSRHRHRRADSRKIDRLNARRVATCRMCRPAKSRNSSVIALPRHHRLLRGPRTRHHQHLRAHAAAQNQRSGHELHRVGRRRDCQALSSRPAGHPGIDDLSRHYRRTPAADLREARATKSAKISSSASRPSASIPAIRSTRRKHAEGGRRHHPRLHGNGQALLLAGAGKRRARHQHARGRDGEAAGEHLPHDQHRPGERNGADVRRHGDQRLGSHRRGRDQAVRLHAVLSRSGPRRTLHSHRSVLSFVEDQAVRHRGALHRARRLHQRQHAALCGRQGAARAEPSQASR